MSSNVAKFRLKSVEDLRNMIEHIDEVDTDGRTKTILVELAQNMVAHSNGGEIYKNGVKIHAWHDQRMQKAEVDHLNAIIDKSNTDEPETLNGLGFYMMFKDGWSVKAKARGDKTVVILRRTQ